MNKIGNDNPIKEALYLPQHECGKGCVVGFHKPVYAFEEIPRCHYNVEDKEEVYFLFTVSRISYAEQNGLYLILLDHPHRQEKSIILATSLMVYEIEKQWKDGQDSQIIYVHKVLNDEEQKKAIQTYGNHPLIYSPPCYPHIEDQEIEK